MIPETMHSKIIGAAEELADMDIYCEIYSPGAFADECAEWDLPSSRVLGFTTEQEGMLTIRLAMNYDVGTLIHECAHCVQYAQTGDMDEDSILEYIQLMFSFMSQNFAYDPGLLILPTDCL